MAITKPTYQADSEKKYTNPVVKQPKPQTGGAYTTMSAPTTPNIDQLRKGLETVRQNVANRANSPTPNNPTLPLTQKTATFVDKPTVNLGGSAALNAYRDEEIRKKAESGQALLSPTEDKQKLYDYYQKHYADLTKGKAQTGQALGNPNTWKMGVYQNELTDIYGKEVQNEIQKQIDAYNADLARSQQANLSAVADNNAYLQEQLQGFQKQKAVTDNQSQMLANRRGGFYSGGLDYQLGQNAASFNEQTGALQRDIGRRNAEIYGRNALLAEEASKKISQLQLEAPDKIRQRVQAQLDKLYNRSVDEAALTGKFNGQNTIDYENMISNRKLAEAGLTGVYNGTPTLANQQWQQQFGLDQQRLGLQAQGQQFDQQFQVQQFAYKKLRDSIDDQRWQQQFDQDVYQFGINYALQRQIQLGNLSIDQARLALSQQEFGLAQDKFTFDQQQASQEQTQPSVDVNKYTGQLNKRFLTKDEDTGQYTVNDEEGLYRSIIGLNLGDNETVQLLSMYGLMDKISQDFLQP